MLDEGKVNQFAMKWLEKYQSEKTMEFEVEEGFGEECFSLGFKMDCGNAFETTFPNTNAFNSYEELEKIIEQIEDIDLFCSAIFSKWRYVTHWAEADLLESKNRRWFIIAFSRLIIISKECV